MQSDILFIPDQLFMASIHENRLLGDTIEIRVKDV
jgi:hypothetical protein